VPTVLITGASRGLGLEHARQYAEQGWQVVACARRTVAGSPLARLAVAHPGRLEIVTLEVTSAADLSALDAVLAGRAIDVLVNNAGTFGPKGAPEGMAYQGLEHMDFAIWRHMLEVNLLAPFRIAVTLLPNLRRARRPLLVMMSSDLGSIAQNTAGSSHSYRSSKAALNMVTRGMAAEWTDVICIAMAPGWTRTDLGGADAPLDAADSVGRQQQVFAALTGADSGRFVNRFGEDVPW